MVAPAGVQATRKPSRHPARAIGLTVVGALVAAALVPEIRLGVLIALGVGLLLGRPFPAALWPVAAAIPAAVNLAWATLPPPSRADTAWCADLLSPPALWRAGEAIVVLVVVGLLLRHLGSTRADIGLVRPSRSMLVASLAAAVAVTLGSLALGTILAGPFFGTIQLKLDDPRAIVPALILALANGSMEEVAYRGAMLGWLTPGLGARVALIAQAVVFGAAHGGGDFVTSPLPVMAAIATGGIIAGLIVQRYRSLAFPIAVHVAFDIPLYYVAACRLA